MSLAKAAICLQIILRHLDSTNKTSAETLVKSLWVRSHAAILDGQLRSGLGGSSAQCDKAPIVWEQAHLESCGDLRQKEQEVGQDALSNLSKRWDNRKGKPDVQLHVNCLQGSSSSWSFGQGDGVQSYVDKEQVDKALLQMDQQGTVPSVEMYRCLLRACTGTKRLVLLKRVHAHLSKNGLETRSFLGNYVVSMLVKCGGLEDALEVFQRLPHRTAASWTAIICAYTNAGQGLKALNLYRHMEGEGVPPDKYTFASLLKACGSIADLDEGKHIHSQAVNSRCGTDLVVGTCVVDMYAKCGSISDAQHVFDTLLQRDVVTWNVMLAAYCQQGQGERTLQLYYRMLMESGVPDDRTFVRVLQACGSLAEKERHTLVNGQLLRVESIQRGKAVHAEAWSMGFESDVYVGSTLVSMYGKCGSTMDAETVFYGLSQRNVVSWAAMLAAYVQQNLAERACDLYDHMLDAGVSPNDRSFVNTLQALGNLADKEDNAIVDKFSVKLESLQKGKALHTESLRRGLGTDVFVCNALLSMYAKCGSIMDAQHVFQRLSQRDVVSWNALLAAYTQQGEGEKAFQLYHEMKEENVVSPDAGTFVNLLQACGNLTVNEKLDLVDEQFLRMSSLQKCKALHADALRRGLEQDVYFSSTLVSMYTKCGSLVDAKSFFDGLSDPDVVSWNAILTGYAQQGQGEKALKFFGQMQESGVSPDVWTFVSALQACGMVGETKSTALVDEKLFQMQSLQQGKGLHAESRRRGYDLYGFLGNALVSMYGRCGSILGAQDVFARLSQRDVVSWNALLAAYIQQNQGEKALQLYYQMQEEVVTPDSRTFVSLLQACGCLAEQENMIFLEGQSVRAVSLQRVKLVHFEAQRNCCESEVFVVNTLITMYAKCGSTLDAHQVFDRLPQRNVVSWNAMLGAYAQDGQGEKCLQLYQEMLMEDVNPDDSTFVCLLQACANIGALDICERIHQSLVSKGKNLSPVLAGTLIHSYGKFARMEAARDVFDILRDSNVITWTALIAGYAREGNYEKSLQCYEEMQLAGVEPNGVTFCSLLSACSHAGMVDRGIEYFESMTTDYGITPETEHYVSIMDLLGRAGYFRLLEDLLSKMPTQPDLSMWLCILSSCRKHGNVELGKRAFDSAVGLQPESASAYFLMANIYSQVGMWECAREVHELREEAGAWKKPGHSWVEHEQEVQKFLVEERGHPLDEHIYDLVGKLSRELEEGYRRENEGDVQDVNIRGYQ